MTVGSDDRAVKFLCWGLIAFVSLGVFLRVDMLQGEHLAPSTLSQLDRGQLLSDPNAQLYCFDAQVPVILSVGLDGQPGHADKDDNADGQLNDRGETGAVGSDDRCLAPTDPGYPSMLADDRSLVISRGAYVPCEDPDSASRRRVGVAGWVIDD